MDDIVRRALNAIAGEMPPPGTPAPNTLPVATRRRARRRMASTAIGALAAVALIAYGGTAAVGTMHRRPPQAPASIAACGWSEVPSPNVNPSTDTNELVAVAAVADDDVWAVGGHYREGGEGSGPSSPLIEHWDGAAWSVAPIPDTGSGSLASVAVVSRDDVWAVGSGEDGAGGLLLEHWDGSTWSVSPAPQVGKEFVHLSAVDAIAADDVWAVGGWATGQEGGPLTIHWDGVAWNVVPSPSPPPDPLSSSPYPGLQAVRAFAADDVWAVGARENVAPPDASNTLALHWDGTAWSVVPSPDATSPQGVPTSQLMGVGGASPQDVWSVGVYSVEPPVGYPGRALIEHWDGSAWRIVPQPLGGVGDARESDLRAVVGTGPDRAWAVGAVRGPPDDRLLPLVETWDGSAWTIVTDLPGESGFLSGVAVAPSGSLWAVGEAFTDGDTPGRTLVLREECGTSG